MGWAFKTLPFFAGAVVAASMLLPLDETGRQPASIHLLKSTSAALNAAVVARSNESLSNALLTKVPNSPKQKNHHPKKSIGHSQP